MRLPPALSEPSPQDVLLAQGGDRAAQLRVNTQRSRIRKRVERERILAEQHDGAQSDAGTEGAEQSDARDGAGAVLDVATQGDDALPDDARGAGDADDAGFEDDGGFDGGFDDDDDDAVEQVCAQRGVRGVRWHWLTTPRVLCVRRPQSPLLAPSPLLSTPRPPRSSSGKFCFFILYASSLCAWTIHSHCLLILCRHC